MNPLWDREVVRRLRRAVVAESRSEWSAGLRMRKVGWLGRWFRATIILLARIAVGGVGPCIPLIVGDDYGDREVMDAAYGLQALFYVGAGAAAVGYLNRPLAIEVGPLANAPVSGRFIYLWCLVNQRKQLALIVGATSLVGALSGMTMSLQWGSRELVNCLSVGGGVGALLGLSGLACASLLVFWTTAFVPLGRVLVTATLVTWLYLVCMLKESALPFPMWFGKLLAVLPQASVCKWLCGGAVQPESLLLLGSLVIVAVVSLLHYVRDQRPDSAEWELEVSPQLTAETLLAHNVAVWRRAGLGVPAQQELAEEPVNGAANEMKSDSDDVALERLMLSADAPQRHSEPVSDEFKMRIARSLRVLVDLPIDAGPASDLIAPGNHSVPTFRLLVKWSLGCGLFSVVAGLMSALLPGDIGSIALVLASVVPVALLYLIAGRKPSTENLPGVWVWLPISVDTLLEPVRKRLTAVLWARLLAISIWLSFVALAGLMVNWLHEEFRLQYASSFSGRAVMRGLPFAFVGIAGLVLLVRAWDTLSLVGRLIQRLKWRGIWSLTRGVCWAFLFGIAGSLCTAVFCIFISIEDADLILPGFGALAITETLRWTLIRFIALAATRGRSDFV